MAVTMNSATFMGKNFQDNQNSIVNTTDLTLKKMFDISAKLVGEQDEIFNVDTIRWEKHLWKYLSVIGRLHCPGVNSEAKDMESCQFTSLPTRSFCKSAQSLRSSHGNV